MAGVAGGEEAPCADFGAAVAKGGLGAVLVEDGGDELGEGDFDGGSTGAAEGEGEGVRGGGQGAGDDVAVVLVVDCADAGEDVGGDGVGEVGVCCAGVEDDGEGEVVLGVLGFAARVGEGEGGEGDGEVGIGAVGALLDREDDEGRGEFGGVEAAEEDGSGRGV